MTETVPVWRCAVCRWMIQQRARPYDCPSCGDREFERIEDLAADVEEKERALAAVTTDRDRAIEARERAEREANELVEVVGKERHRADLALARAEDAAAEVERLRGLWGPYGRA